MKRSSFLQMISTEKLYQQLVNPILAKDDGLDPERLTQIALGFLSQASIYRNSPLLSAVFNKLDNELTHKDPRLEQKLLGCDFQNPIGLAAGFDKNGVAAGVWNYFGFGFAEIGTVTWHAQEGNPLPRLFRLAKEQAALNRMGFNNKGAYEMSKTLKKQNLKDPKESPLVLGINLGKSKITPLEQAQDDYAASLELLSNLADYVVINVSSPNTPGLRTLQEPLALKRLIKRLKVLPDCPPLLVKISPDLENQSIQDIATLASEEEVAGLIAVNTSLDRLGLKDRVIKETGNKLEVEPGGLSGLPLCERATEVIHLLRKTSHNDLLLIGVGGINSPQAAWERMTAGASLVQLYTGWIFKGPILVTNILKGFSNQLDRHGFKNISEAIGSNAPWI